MDQRLLFLILVYLVTASVATAEMRVSSYFRTPEQNRAVGGRPNSLHLVGLAIDMVGEYSDMIRLGNAWRSLGLDAVFEGDHVHLELDGPSIQA